MKNEFREEKKINKNIPFLVIIILIAVITGLAFDISRADSDNFYKETQRFDQVFLNVHQKYVEEIGSKKLIDNAIDGMLKILDPHSAYFEKKQYEELLIQTEGKFGGLGIQISIRDKVLTVMTPIPGTPAERAGIQSGDQIIKINGISTQGITVEEAVKKLRGEPNTEVTLTIRRRGEPKDLEYKIVRAIIQIKAVPFYGVFRNNIGYIVLKSFSQDAGAEVEKAIKELLKQNIKGLVFDLRYNPGGLLPQAIEIAEKFLARNSLIVYTRGRLVSQNAEYYAKFDPVLPSSMPLVILVNNASASASEIVAGAIQDWDRGIILGDTTFGKGSVQSILQIDDVNHLKLTTAYYYTPSGRCINKPENSIRGKKNKSEDEDQSDEEQQEQEGKKADSSQTAKDTTKYLTKNKRTVYGGGGIIPDTVVKQKIPDLVIRSLFLKDAFFSFANIEYPKLLAKKIKVNENLVIDNAIMKDFYSFLDSTNFKFQSIVQMAFDEFKNQAGLVDTLDTSKTKASNFIDKILQKPQWNKDELEILKSTTTQLQKILENEKKREIAKCEEEIKNYIKQALLSRMLGNDHELVYKEKLNNDEQFKSALNIISDTNTYQRLLLPKTK
jgi:carboxyl-terminal processing protease